MALWQIGPISDMRLTWGTIRGGTPHECPYCHISLLTGETPGFCCGPNGSRLHDVPPLPPLPPEYNTFINSPDISSLSRVLNLIFSFAALETTHNFPNIPNGPAFVSIQGRVYHRIRPNHYNSAVRWLLHDGFIQDLPPFLSWAAIIPLPWRNALQNALISVNPFVFQLRQLSAISPSIPSAHLILRDTGTTAEIAAIMSYENTTQQQTRSRRLTISKTNGQNVSIPTTSRMWEPLAYPLFFPHATLGWGLHESDPTGVGNSNNHQLGDGTTQIWHYRARLLREDRFSILGRLANEYLVDMFSRNLESRLDYIINFESNKKMQP
ncbi:hypothetical protein CVT24_002342 [Panaeolus cyanescens]|uniref:Helitron helicase-like domain-containing protein n=1 Tax=Panaeolus cyanescens TaxID=181874 RepID=A0A409X4U5_9AGAR|nr:hypothetical protein CVT24_002342 [Panaeolus cyanescens]